MPTNTMMKIKPQSTLCLHVLTLMAFSLARRDIDVRATNGDDMSCCGVSISMPSTSKAPPTVKAAGTAAQTYTAFQSSHLW